MEIGNEVCGKRCIVCRQKPDDSRFALNELFVTTANDSLKRFLATSIECFRTTPLKLNERIALKQKTR